ncbi:MAG: ABC transporter permease [bacterium]|nr:ABC transporter permease [bacterium]
MELRENFTTAWQVLSRNRTRSFLTMLGIVIGIAAVMVVMSVGAGAQSLILNQVKSMGTNLVGVLPGKSDEKGPPVSVMGVVITTLKYDDGKALLSGICPMLKAVAMYVRGADTVVWNGRKLDTTFIGVNAGYPDVEEAVVGQGRFFTEDEEKSAGRVAVIGSQVADELFGEQDPLGERLKIKKTNFYIIGVMEERGMSGFQNQDNQIFVPIKAAQNILLGIDHISMMRVKVDKAENINGAVDCMAAVLRERHNIDRPEDDDFTVRSAAQGLEAMTKITNALRFFLAAIAAIALIVGGVGIMNIMLAAVQERTREIGLRKAVGAKRFDVMEQFLVETILITFCGGLVGIILGALISVIVAKIAQAMGYHWNLIVSASSILLGAVVSLGIGFLFGLIPARRASRLNPIEALRYE